jgi:5-methylcytosine-specific restriction protein A
MNFYKTSKWKKKRENVLRRDEYLCRQCKRYGKNTQATTVHHVQQLETHPELRLDSNNLLSVCHICHNTFHDRVTNELTSKGIEWVERVSRGVKDNGT